MAAALPPPLPFLPPLHFAAIVFTRCRMRQMDPGVATGNPNEKIPVQHCCVFPESGKRVCAPAPLPPRQARRRDRPSWLHLPTYANEASSPRRSSSLFFISLIGNLSALCEIKAENQCLVSNNFQTNLFHLLFPPPSSFSSLAPHTPLAASLMLTGGPVS